MTTPADVLRIAISELGQTESPPNSNRNKFGEWYGANGQPWCAMFLSYCFYNAGLPLVLTTAKGFAYCPYGVSWFKKIGRVVSVQEAQPGDVVFFQFDRDPQADHVGIIESVEPGFFNTVEGNTSVGNDSNGGIVMRRRRSHSLVALVGRPVYDGAPAPAAPAAPVPHAPAPSIPSAPPWPGRNIQLTSPLSRGNDIATWQQRMRDRGWKIAVDGIWGRESDGVCRKFQAEKRLVVDGIVGPKTWAAAWTAPVT